MKKLKAGTSLLDDRGMSEAADRAVRKAYRQGIATVKANKANKAKADKEARAAAKIADKRNK